MSLRKIKRNINYCVLIIGLGVWGSCNPKSQHVLLPVDNVKSIKYVRIMTQQQFSKKEKKNLEK